MWLRVVRPRAPLGAGQGEATNCNGHTVSGSYVLTAHSTSGSYAPTFTGNGYIGIRVPPAGQGYAATPVPIKPTLAGFYARAPGQVQQRADPA